MDRKTLLPLFVLFIAVLSSGCAPTAGDQAATSAALASTAPQQVNTLSPTEAPYTPIPSITATPTIALPPSETPTSPPTMPPTITPTFSPDTLTFEAGAPLKIGYLLWESDPIGLDAKRGIEIAIQNIGGELLGHPIELTGFDDECSELAGQRGAQILGLDDGVVGIVGPSCSSAAFKAAPIISDQNKVLISPSTSHPELTATDARTPGFFRTAQNDLVQMNSVAQYAFDQLGGRRMASIHEDVKRQKFRSEHLCQSFTALGGECVLEKPLSSDATYMAPVINNILSAKPDVIHLTHFSPKVAAAFIAEVKETAGLENIPIFVFEGLNTPDFLREAGDNAVGVYVTTTNWDYDQNTDAYQDFLTTYREKYGEEPLTVFHGYAFDAASLLLGAISRVAVQAEDGSLRIDPLAVRDAIYSLVEFPGLTGPLTCSPSGDCAPDLGGKVYQFVDGDPDTFNPGLADKLSSNPAQVWP